MIIFGFNNIWFVNARLIFLHDPLIDKAAAQFCSNPFFWKIRSPVYCQACIQNSHIDTFACIAIDFFNIDHIMVPCEQATIEISGEFLEIYRFSNHFGNEVDTPPTSLHIGHQIVQGVFIFLAKGRGSSRYQQDRHYSQ